MRSHARSSLRQTSSSCRGKVTLGALLAAVAVAGWYLGSSTEGGHTRLGLGGASSSSLQIDAYDTRCDEVPRRMCKALNREPCSSMTLLNTCGRCISEEYAPIANDVFAPCVPKSKLKSDGDDSSTQGCPKCPECGEGSAKKVLVENMDAESLSPTYNKLVDSFFGGKNPWEGYASNFEADHSYPHTSVVPQFLSKLFTVAQPELIVEYGSFKGGSAAIMASVVKDLAMEGRTAILCVDPWTGDVNMWLDFTGWRSWLMLDHGVPHVAEQFRVNIIDQGHHDVIVPLQATSMVGIVSIWKMYNDKKEIPLPSVVYLDSAHEKDETFIEITRVMRSLPPGGFMFGDDWGWYGVSHDVKKYAVSDEGMKFVNKSIPEEFFEDWDDYENRAEFSEIGVWLFNDAQWVLHKRMDQEAS